MDPNHRQRGSTNGWFGGHQYFTCEENAGLFISLERLSPMDLEQPQQDTLPATDRRHPMVTRSRDQGGQPSQPDIQRHNHRNRSPTPKRLQFKLGDRVVAYDRNGQGIHGSVRWMGKANTEVGNVPVVGIETDVAVQSKEFVGSLTGLGQHFKCSDSGHGKVVMPESMVALEHEDAARRDKQKQLEKGSSVDRGVADVERDILSADQQRQVKYLQGALHTSVVDHDEQVRAYKEFEKAKEEKQKRLSGTRPDRNSGSHYEQIPGERFTSDLPPSYQQATSRTGGVQRQVSASTVPSAAEVRKTNFDSPGRSRKDLVKMGDNRSFQGEYRPSHQHGHLGPGGAAALMHQRSVPVGVNEHADDEHYVLAQAIELSGDGGHPPHVYDNIPGLRDNEQRALALQQSRSDGTYMNYPSSAPSNQDPRYRGNQPSGSSYPGSATERGGAYDRDHVYDQPRDPAYQQGYQYQDNEAYRRNQGYGYSQNQYGTAGGPAPPTQLPLGQGQPSIPRAEIQQPDMQPQGVQYRNMPNPNMQHQPGTQHPSAEQGFSPPHSHHSDAALIQGGNAMAVALQPTFSFSMGSTVQLTTDPRRYGVIRWMGTLPDIHGRIAGVELEDSIDGAQDGTWKGVRYFSCLQGHGLFCPVSSLAPDQRFTPNTSAGAAVNPLDFVAFEEERDQHIDPGLIYEYLGEAKGIQGHQNSCYLDSTVFGLFALSDVFDSMFLEPGKADPAGDDVKHLLWKGIVNPLRKNGVVRYESVMRLRNKLEELGKMKGVNQDEKDPEEFLNMLFKHTLHVTPFIKIKRPFGVEQEYFVQLFVEQDKSLQLPTVGELLTRMFIEQKIRFTKVPSKLLIQIPRYGREFKTYQKTIPGLKLELTKLVCSKNKCFICADSSWTECRECISEFVNISQSPSVPTDVVYFCEKCSESAHSERTKRSRHKVTEVTPDLGGVNELDLLSVICIETSHYICFTRSEERWVFFDSMASRVEDMYNIPKVVDCTDVLNEWVYPANGDMTRLLNTPPKELPEYVRRFTQDIYLVVYIQPDFAMYGDVDNDDDDDDGN